MPLALYKRYIRQYRDMVSDQAARHQSNPHEGCRIAMLPPAIVGLMRNSLSEVFRIGVFGLVYSDWGLGIGVSG